MKYLLRLSRQAIERIRDYWYCLCNLVYILESHTTAMKQMQDSIYNIGNDIHGCDADIRTLELVLKRKGLLDEMQETKH